MDYERTFQMLMTSHANSVRRLDRIEASLARSEARVDRIEARINQMEARFDRRIAAITKLIHTGMKMMVELQNSQRETDRALKAFMASMRKGTNGRGPK